MVDCVHLVRPPPFLTSALSSFLLSSLINCQLCFLFSYGRLYAADPYHHTLTPATTYGVGAVVSADFRLSFLPEPPLASLPPPLLYPVLSMVDIFSLSP